MSARSVRTFKSVNFGRGRKSLSTVGFTVYNSEGTESESRSTSGVNEVGTSTGIYGAQVTLATDFSGSILWDSGQGDNNAYAAEEINSIDGNVQYIRDLTAGTWEINKSTSQMIFYAEDTSTAIATYDLKDSDGSASVSEVFKREKV